MASLTAIVWIPAFAGMTGANTNFETYPYRRREPLIAIRVVWFRTGWLAGGRGLGARGTLILAFSRKGIRDPLAAIRALWFRMGWLAGGRGLGACDTLTLALSHEGRGDLSLAIVAWFGFAYPLSHEGDGDSPSPFSRG